MKKDLLKKMLLKKQRESLMRVGSDRYQWLKRFAEENIMLSRKLLNKHNPQSKEELSDYNRARLENAYKHPFEKIPEEFFENND